MHPAASMEIVAFSIMITVAENSELDG
jgi:hypothetical protein